MKRILLLLAAVAALTAAQAQQHIEFKWHRWYGVGGYAFSTNINTTDFADKATFNSVYAVGGWQIRKASGIGLGFQFMHDGTGAFSQLPLFVELRSHYLRSQITPFTTARIGYSIPLGSSSGGTDAIQIAKGGAFWGLHVGARYAFSRTLAANAYVGYEGIHMAEVDRYQDGKRFDGRPLTLQNITVGVGVNF